MLAKLRFGKAAPFPNVWLTSAEGGLGSLAGACANRSDKPLGGATGRTGMASIGADGGAVDLPKEARLNFRLPPVC